MRLRRVALALEWAVAIGATGLIVLMGVTFLTHSPGLWRDELGSVNTQAASWPQMWRLYEFESFPLLWPMLLRAWMSLGGQTDFGLRVFGLACACTVPVAVWIAARHFDRRLPLMSLALVAVNPDILRWSATVRPWGLGAALAILATVRLWSVAVSPTRRNVLLAGIAAILSVQCLYQNAIFLAAGVAGCAVVALRRRAWSSVLVPVGIGLAAAVSLLPYAGVITRRSEWNMLGQVSPSVGTLITRAAAVLDSAGHVVFGSWVLLIGIVLALALWPVPLPSSAEDPGREDAGWYASVVGLASIIGTVLFYLWFRYATQPWYYLGMAVIVAVCAERAILSIASWPATRTGLAAAAAIILVCGFSTTLAQVAERQTNLDVVAARISAEAGAGDLVIVNPWFCTTTIQHYYTGPATITSVPPLSDYSTGRADLLKTQMLSPDPLGPLRARIRDVLLSGHRIWFVGNIDLLAAGEALPALPPPPRPDSGWSSIPDQNVWSVQIGTFIQQHVAGGHRIAIYERGSRLEDADLTELSGWR